MADWLSALQQFKDSNPDLPEGREPSAAPDSEIKRKKEKLNIIYERKGRAGKPATIICGFAETTSDAEIEELAKDLKKRLGAGGSVRGGEILIQGDKRAALSTLLKEKGYTTNI